MTYDFDEVIDRRGTFCTQWDYIQDRFGQKDLLPFSISDTDFRVPEPIQERLRRAIDHGIYGYSRWNHSAYKGAISRYFKERHQAEGKEDWVVYSPSVLYSISVLFRLLGKPGDGILVLQPMYDAFYRVVQDNGYELVTCDLREQNGHYEIDFGDFEEKAKKSRIFLLCSPHNPTGRVWTEGEMEQMMRICCSYGLPVISDEIHSDIILTDRKHITALRYQGKNQVYLVSSSSKTFNTPALIGSYALIPDEKIRAAFMSRLRNQDFLNSVSLLGMYAAITGYEQCMDYADQLVEYTRSNMMYLKNFIDRELSPAGVSFTIPEATYLAWIDVRQVPASSQQLQKALVDSGKVGIMPGETYGGAGHLRMNLGCPKAKLEEGTRRMKTGFQALGAYCGSQSGE